jgi:serine/threonine protein kinase
MDYDLDFSGYYDDVAMSDKNRRDALKPGAQIHWYRIERVLGQGGFGITYLADDTNLEQRVAIKEFLPLELALRLDDSTVQPRSADENDDYYSALDRFISEARTLARFDHPNIVRVHSVFEANNTAYMVMRYEQGDNLHDRLSKYRTLDEKELMQLVRPILSGLAQVHAAGFIHRDIQPGNIHLRDDGTPVLLDFGSAREALGRSRTLTIMVAPGYAPFEQYYTSGAQQGPWTDIYGLGATLYRAVAGVPPIDAIERSRGILGSTRDVLIPAATVGQGRYSPYLLDAIDHALKFDSRDRPPSVEEWLVDFDKKTSQPTGRSFDSRERSPTKREFESSLPSKEPVAAPKPRAPILVGLLIAAAVFGGLTTALLMRAAEQAPVSSSAPLSPTTPGIGEVDQRRGELDDLRQKVIAENQLYKETQSRIEDGERQLANLERRLEQSKQEDEASTSRLNTLIEEVQTREADLARLQGKLRSLRQTRDTLADESDGLQDELSALRVRKSSLEEEVAALEKEATPAPDGPDPATEPDPARPGPDDPLLSGTAAYEAGDHAAAMASLRPLANAGDAQAAYYVARMLSAGQGATPDPDAAVETFKTAAEQGHVGAQLELGKSLANGEGVEPDDFYAYVWLAIAAEGGNSEAGKLRDTIASRLQPVQIEQANEFAAAKRRQIERNN